MQHRELLASVLFAGITRWRLKFEGRGGLNENPGIADRLHYSVASGVIAFIAFLDGLIANFGDEILRLRTASGSNGNDEGEGDQASKGSEMGGHVRIVSRTLSFTQAGRG